MQRSKFSAGLILYNWEAGFLRVLLVHPGGPYFQHEDLHAWGVPKGELDSPDETPLQAAKREFFEETGHVVPTDAAFIDLGEILQPNGKTVRSWGFEGHFDPSRFRSNTCEIEWPPRSGRRLEIPENDRAELFDLPTAQRKCRRAQWPLVARLRDALAHPAEVIA